MYEVLDYESTLEITDKNGREAIFEKRERVRYLSENIIAYQDEAWGDGKILEDYRCTPGIPVDRYRLGYKTHILISLRTVRNRGDEDQISIEWKIRKGFLSQTCFWATEVNHKTSQMTVKIILPGVRPPHSVTVVERNRQRSLTLEEKCKTQLPDKRWQITWENKQPHLHEQYILKWEW